MACVNILLDDKMIDVATKAVVEKMGRLNGIALISGLSNKNINKKMTDDYKDCETLLDALNKAKETLAAQKSMAK